MEDCDGQRSPPDGGVRVGSHERHSQERGAEPATVHEDKGLMVPPKEDLSRMGRSWGGARGWNVGFQCTHCSLPPHSSFSSNTGLSNLMCILHAKEVPLTHAAACTSCSSHCEPGVHCSTYTTFSSATSISNEYACNAQTGMANCYNWWRSDGINTD